MELSTGQRVLTFPTCGRYNPDMDSSVFHETVPPYVTIKTPEQVDRMRRSCRLAAQALQHTLNAVAPGISTGELDMIAFEFMVTHGASSSSLGYKGFPRAICTSVNDVVCHGIPSDDVVLKDGDIINVDLALCLDGWHGDNSATVVVGQGNELAKKLVRVTRECLGKAISIVKPGLRTREIGAVIEDHATANGFSTVRDYVGHGIGIGYHELPEILHYRNAEPCVRLRPGMVFTIEPMICVGKPDTFVDPDGWTVKTSDGLLSAQHEHTILVTETGYEILTLP